MFQFGSHHINYDKKGEPTDGEIGRKLLLDASLMLGALMEQKDVIIGLREEDAPKEGSQPDDDGLYSGSHRADFRKILIDLRQEVPEVDEKLRTFGLMPEKIKNMKYSRANDPTKYSRANDTLWQEQCMAFLQSLKKKEHADSPEGSNFAWITFQVRRMQAVHGLCGFLIEECGGLTEDEDSDQEDARKEREHIEKQKVKALERAKPEEQQTQAPEDDDWLVDAGIFATAAGGGEGEEGGGRRRCRWWEEEQEQAEQKEEERAVVKGESPLVYFILYTLYCIQYSNKSPS
jgi:hypothetical protein